MKKELEEEVQFRFANILLTSKTVKELNVLNAIIDLRNINFTFTINFETKISVDIKNVIINVHILINEVAADGAITMVSEFKISNFFEIINFDKVIKLNKDGLYVVPPNFENIIRPASISTARGIIYSELLGTYLQGVIMPIVYMDTFKPLVTE